ncbi:hypothetical protein HPB52_005996 [Rhipicephalus sanguineus]|uniref:SCP domain-containing protein n=2 Tax=Rhipicephalus sanguineus TaxID=34632 RepID=A0A9D4PUL7_RHISA|nr:hypothetical protein HPB52_005996 [Rhipicephalus sanguineus]
MERAAPTLLCICFTLIVAVRTKKPCPSPYNATHTMCMPPYQSCTTLYSDTPASFVTILWVHNHYRSHLALGQLANFPSAANMLQLRWDDDLAAVAEARARRCIGPEGVLFTDTNEQRWTADFPLVGQNVLNQRSKEDRLSVNWEHVVRDWFKQNTLFTADQAEAHSAVFGAEAFNQMAWARTYAIGCSYTSNEVPAFKPESKVFIYVCNYGPQSGEIGQPLYQAGEPCSLCPEDTMCDPTTGLCMLQGDKPGRDKTTTTRQPSLLATPAKARESAAGPVAVAVDSTLAAALVAVHVWHQGVA